MKSYVYLIFILLILSCETEDAGCDNGTFVGNVSLTTQQEVNDFGAMCYTKVQGRVSIGDYDADSDIDDLSPLSSLNEIYANPSDDNEWSGNLTIYAHNLTNLDGLENLIAVGGLSIYDCYELTNLNGLNGLQLITHTNNYRSHLWFRNLPQLTSLEGLTNLTSIGDFTSYSLIKLFKVNLENLNGLQGISELNHLEIYGSSITSLEGLHNLQSVTEELKIGELSQLTNLEGLNSLVSVGNLTIGANFDLLNIDALSNLEYVGNISTLVEVSCGPTCHVIFGNPLLSDFCGFQNLFTNGSYQDVEIADNAYNPSVQDIIDGNCAQ